MNLQSVFTGIWLEYFSIAEKLQYWASYISMNYYTKRVTQPCRPLQLFHSSYAPCSKYSMFRPMHWGGGGVGGFGWTPHPPPPPVRLCCPCDWYHNFCKPICMHLCEDWPAQCSYCAYLKVTIMGRLTQQVGRIEWCYHWAGGQDSEHCCWLAEFCHKWIVVAR